MTEKKEIKENELENVAGGQTDNNTRPTLGGISSEEELGGKIHVTPTDEHIIPPFEN